MKASELVTALNNIIKVHGDVPVEMDTPPYLAEQFPVECAIYYPADAGIPAYSHVVLTPETITTQ